MNKIISIVIVLIIIAGVFWYFYPSNPTPPSTQTPIVTPDTTPSITEAENVVIDIKGSNFAFDVKEIQVTEGDTVTINFESTEGFHDWVVDEFNAATAQVNPGTPTSVTFVADKAGTYEYYCSVMQHRSMGMIGALVVNIRQ
jgi:plastocyanin